MRILRTLVGLFASCILLGAAAWIFLSVPAEWRAIPILQKAPAAPPDVASLTRAAGLIVKKTENAISAPPPLKQLLSAPSESRLTRAGVVIATNDRRVTYGLPTLAEDGALNRAAELKLTDLFEKQYFEHIAPDGTGPSHWVELAGYQYRLIGENLALGNFDDDDDLVTAWLESPGHRENILKPEFTAIGVAVGKGLYEGKEVWIGVQTFGDPLPDCPVPDAALKAAMTDRGNTLDALKQQMDALRAEIEAKQDENDPARDEVRIYNGFVQEYNSIVATLKAEAKDYNAQVDAYNACIAP